MEHFAENSDKAHTRDSWTDLRSEFLKYAGEYAGLAASWRWIYPGSVILKVNAIALSLGPDVSPYEVLKWMYESPEASADASGRPPAPKGEWTLEGGPPASQDLFRVIAGRAVAKLLNECTEGEPWRLWLDRLRAEGYASEVLASTKSGQATGPYPKGFEDQCIDHVFKASADFCRARSVSAHATPPPAGNDSERLDVAWFRHGDASVSLRKHNGTVLGNLHAQFSANAILILHVDTPIEEGDMLIRILPSGLRVGFIVDDPGYREAIGSIPSHYEVKAHRGAPIDALEASGFWHERRAEFEQLSDRQREQLGIDRNHRKWLKGICGSPDDDTGEFADCLHIGGLDHEFLSKFQDVATQAGIALGSPAGADPVEFWLSCLCLDLLQSARPGARKELWESIADGGIIHDLLASSSAYCSRLAAMTERKANDAPCGELPREADGHAIQATLPSTDALVGSSDQIPTHEKLGIGGGSLANGSSWAKNPFPNSYESWAKFANEAPERLKAAADNAARDNSRINSAISALLNTSPPGRQERWQEVLPTLRHRRPMSDWPDAAPIDDNEAIELLMRALDDPAAAVLRRLDTLAGEALRKFVVAEEYINSYVEMVPYLAACALAALPSPTDHFRDQISARQKRWQSEARESAGTEAAASATNHARPTSETRSDQLLRKLDPSDNCVPSRRPKDFVDASKRRPKRSYEKFAAHIGISKDTLYAITKETRWVSNETYALVAEACHCTPEDLHPRDLPQPERRRG